MFAKLRVEDITDNWQKANHPTEVLIYSGSILNSSLVIETAENAYKSGNFPKIPLIIGSCRAVIEAGFIDTNSNEDLFMFLAARRNKRKLYTGNTKFAEL